MKHIQQNSLPDLNGPIGISRRESMPLLAAGLLALTGCFQDTPSHVPDRTQNLLGGTVTASTRARDSGGWIKVASSETGPYFVQAMTAYKGSIRCTESISVNINSNQVVQMPRLKGAFYVQIVRKNHDDSFDMLGLRCYSSDDKERAYPRFQSFMEAPGQYLIQGFTSYKPPPSDVGHTYATIKDLGSQIELVTRSYFSYIQVVKVTPNGKLEGELKYIGR